MLEAIDQTHQSQETCPHILELVTIQKKVNL
jgi:hypothetical protein